MCSLIIVAHCFWMTSYYVSMMYNTSMGNVCPNNDAQFNKYTLIKLLEYQHGIQYICWKFLHCYSFNILKKFLKFSNQFYFLGHSNLITCLTSFFWILFLSYPHPPPPKKSRFLCLTDESGLEIFCQTPPPPPPPPKKKKNNHCKGDSINYRNLSML